MSRHRLRLTIDRRLYRRLMEHSARTGERPSAILEAVLEAYFRPDWAELERLYAKDKAMLEAIRCEQAKLRR